MEFRRVPADVAFPPSPAQFGDQLRAIVDPRTPEEIAVFNEGAQRVVDSNRRLLQSLPVGPSGEVGGVTLVAEEATQLAMPGVE